MTYSSGKSTLHLPRILCLHGGGVNAEVFEMQCRAIIARLRPHFRLVFVDGPFLSPPHPDIVTVYGEYGPFRRWLRWKDDHEEIEADVATSKVISQCRKAMEQDRGTGDWVGVLGFSQGAKVAASMLWTQQEVVDRFGPSESWTNFKFGVLMAGRGPIVSLDSRLEIPEYVTHAGASGADFIDRPSSNDGAHALRIPTLHVHGLVDDGLSFHQRLLEDYCREGTTRLVEWNGAHRLPIKSLDVEAVTSQMLQMAEEAGVTIQNRPNGLIDPMAFSV